ncbi:ABC transporter ATP-binding protein [Xanthobacter sp. KR7-225]|uniref:ABC transporter ATP-binding protein n=1 Tax=Xanthobacter sp. KR7-225 TaxID=3156613 RepID=UPI0032B34A61
MLEVRNLCKSFGGLKAVSEVDLTVGQGEFVGVIGPNGAGKTTLMNLVTGYMRPTSGDVLFEGRSIVGLPPYRISHRGVGRTFQVVRPFAEMSVEDNVMTGALFSGARTNSLKVARQAAQQPMELTGLSAKRHLPAGALTLGEKKKLELARALATSPRLLLLDEVMGGVTRGEVGDLMEVLRRIHAAGVTIVMIEHLVEVIMELSQRVVVLNFGQKLFEGAPAEVVEHPAVIESYLGKPLEADAA